MKIIHTADIHLGSKMEAKFSREIAEKRKGELLSAFNKMLNYAKENGVRVILLSGDVFDTARPFKRDKSLFYNAVANNPDIDFLYLRGNHDTEESYSEQLPNLKTFSNVWQSYEYENVVIYGIELNDDNIKTYYSELKTDASKINIVMLHGQVTSGAGYGINTAKLKNLNIDYLALGHIHSYQTFSLGESGVGVYSGCLEGRGFDEVGEKGFVELDIDQAVNFKFVPNSIRVIREISVDISAASDVYSACQIVEKSVKISKEDVALINLVGKIEFDGEYLTKTVTEFLKNKFYFLYVKDKTARNFSIEKLSGDYSLSGEFIRTVLSNGEYSDEEKQQIISVGLKALNGSEVE